MLIQINNRKLDVKLSATKLENYIHSETPMNNFVMFLNREDITFEETNTPLKPTYTRTNGAWTHNPEGY